MWLVDGIAARYENSAGSMNINVSSSCLPVKGF